MPITLNNSNISVTYNTGSNYIIETVKSDLYVRGTTSGNLSSEPTVSPSIRSADIVVESFTYTTGTTHTTYTKVFSENTLCDILIVGGGGGGGFDGGGGGGGGQVLYYTNDNVSFKSGNAITLNAGTYNISVGKGGNYATTGTAHGLNGQVSSINMNATTILSAGGGGGGGTVRMTSTGNNAIGGGGGNGHDEKSGSSTGGTSSANGGTGGDSSGTTGGGGGGGANIIGTSKNGTNGTESKRGDGGQGVNIIINGLSYGVGGGGGGGTWTGPNAGWALAGASITSHGGGIGGDAQAWGANGTNGTGGGGGGGGWAGNPTFYPGNGGSGIVIVKYKYTNDSKRYRLHFPRKTKVEFILNGDGNRITSNDLQGTYIITITSTKIFIEKEGGGPNNKQEFPSNKIEIIYDLFDTLDNINSTFTDSLTTTKSKPINVYNNTLSSINNGFPFQLNKYNKYKISGFIPKANKNGDNNINFNIDLTVPDPNDTSRLIDMSKDLYSIRYNFQYLQSANEITPIDIYITIKPLPGVINDTISYFAFKTYFRSSGSGLNSSEIQVFLSNTLSIDKFNEISDWITNLNNKNIWGLSNMDKEISDIIRNLLSVDNIDNKCKNDNTDNDLRICDIRKLIYIKNKINGTSVSSTGSPRLIENVSIVSQNVFPRNSPYVNFNIDDYISYESSTLIAPQQRTSTFDIKSTATKYMYFYMGQVS